MQLLPSSWHQHSTSLRCAPQFCPNDPPTQSVTGWLMTHLYQLCNSPICQNLICTHGTYTFHNVISHPAIKRIIKGAALSGIVWWIGDLDWWGASVYYGCIWRACNMAMHSSPLPAFPPCNFNKGDAMWLPVMWPPSNFIPRPKQWEWVGMKRASPAHLWNFQVHSLLGKSVRTFMLSELLTVQQLMESVMANKSKDALIHNVLITALCLCTIHKNCSTLMSCINQMTVIYLRIGLTTQYYDAGL